MPVEIRELIIRTHITTDKPVAENVSVKMPSQKEIVDQCVAKVLRVLSKNNQR